MKKDKNNIEQSDLFLLNQIRLGNKSSFNLFFKKYWKGLYLFSFNILKSEKISEDIVQNVFIDFWEKVQREDIRNPKAYLYKSVKNQVLNHIRNTVIHQKHLEHLRLIYSVQNLEEEIFFRELDNLIVENIEKLPERCREVFELSRIQDLSNKEIADKLNISVQTVKNQISTALRFLRKALQDSV